MTAFTSIVVAVIDDIPTVVGVIGQVCHNVATMV
jgi:hypothetical protein